MNIELSGAAAAELIEPLQLQRLLEAAWREPPEGERPARAARALAPLAEPTPVASLRAELQELAPARALLRKGDWQLYLAPAAEIPALLAEIGRLRELSFREVGEGTGRARDLDAFDAHYWHLFLWNAAREQLAGAYRLGFVDEIRAARGLAGLYTQTLFAYDGAVFAHTGPALELGRSFVTAEWQRSFHPLRLLWSGIAAVLRRRQELRCLFGPVSISPSYSRTGRELIAEVLGRHHSDVTLSGLIRPRCPPQHRKQPEEHRQVISALASPKLLSRVIAALERGPGLPVLLRHYLELNGRFAGFNVDHAFGGTLDGLVFVDVQRIPERVLRRYGGAAA